MVLVALTCVQAAKNLNNKSVAAQAKNALLKQFDLQEYKKMMRNFLDRVAAKFEKPQLYDVGNEFVLSNFIVDCG